MSILKRIKVRVHLACLKKRVILNLTSRLEEEVSEACSQWSQALIFHFCSLKYKMQRYTNQPYKWAVVEDVIHM